MSESWADAAMGCEVRLSLLDGTTTTIQATALSIRLGEATEVEVDLEQFRLGDILLTCADSSLKIQPCAANSIAISVRAYPNDQTAAARTTDSVIDQLLQDRPFTDSAIDILVKLLPFNPKFGAPVLAPVWAPAFTLLAVMCGPRKVGKCALEQLRLDMSSLFRRTEEHLRLRMRGKTQVTDNSELERSRTAMLKPLLDTAAEESRKLGHNWIGTEHLLLAAVKMADPDLQAIFEAQSLSYAAIRARIIEMLGKQ